MTPDDADGTRPRGRPRSADADRAILQAALDLLVERGHYGVSMEAVACRAGVAKTTIYRRWSSKEDLLLDAIESVKGPAPEIPEGGVRDALVTALARMQRNLSAHPIGQLIPRLLAYAHEQPDLVRRYRERITFPRRALFRELLERGQADGLVRADVDTDLAIAMLVDPVIVRRYIEPDRPPLADAEIAFIVDTTLRGLAPR